jgi:glycosyltransferase involved in cell wall biosynthesis
MERYLHARADRERIQNVSFDGFTTGDALTRIVNGARIIILPSIWYENYPLSILEAKASGSLAIGSDIGGIPELLESEFLAPPHDDETLAKRIASWYTAPFFERKKVAVRQRKEVRDTNNPKKHVQEILSLYESLLR